MPADIPKHFLVQALLRFSKLERQVVRMRFGLGGKRPMTIAQIARTLNLRPARVSKIEEKVRRNVAHLRHRAGPDAVD
jgi:DNA-directed RNA polymerase sigma subunit (sigma70/sigma32)